MQRARSANALAAIVIAVLIAGGCAAPQTQPASAAPTVDVTGNWTGMRSYGAGITTPMSLDLQQMGAKVTGTASWGRPPAGSGGTGGPLEGTVSGVTLTFAVPADSSTGELRVSGDDMQGSLAGSFSYQVTLKRRR